MNIEIKQEIKIKMWDQELILTRDEAKKIYDELGKILNYGVTNIRELDKTTIPSPNKKGNDIWPMQKPPYYPEIPDCPSFPKVWCKD